MARLTRAESKALTRKKLCDSARKLIAEKGYSGATVDLIAESAGFSRGAFYSNYESKDELLIDLLDEYFVYELDSLSNVVDEHSDHPDEIVKALERFYNRGKESNEWCRLTCEFFLHAFRSPPFRKRFISSYSNHREQMAKLLEQYLESTGADASFSKLLTPMAMGMSLGYSLQVLAEPKYFSDKSLGKALGSLLELAAG